MQILIYLPVNTPIDIAHRFEAENREDDDACVNGSDGIAAGDKYNITDTVVLRLVIGTKRNERSERQPEGIKYLRGCVQPHRWI